MRSRSLDLGRLVRCYPARSLPTCRSVPRLPYRRLPYSSFSVSSQLDQPGKTSSSSDRSLRTIVNDLTDSRAGESALPIGLTADSPTMPGAWDQVLEKVRLADQFGFDSVWLGEAWGYELF